MWQDTEKHDFGKLSPLLPKIQAGIKDIGLKLTEDEAAKLREYASKHDMTITQVLQRGIHLQYAMEETEGR